MDHHEALRSQCAERYVAGELAALDRDNFEDHFFECPECAEEVRWELIFKANARSVLKNEAAKAAKIGPNLRRPLWFSLAANVALAASLAIVLLTGSRGARQPRMIPAYFALGPTRGLDEMPPNVIPSGAAAFIVRFPSPAQTYASYSYAILGVDGGRESAGVLNSSGISETECFLEVPIKELRKGAHTLEVRASPGDVILSRSRFQTTR